MVNSASGSVDASISPLALAVGTFALGACWWPAVCHSPSRPTRAEGTRDVASVWLQLIYVDSHREIGIAFGSLGRKTCGQRRLVDRRQSVMHQLNVPACVQSHGRQPTAKKVSCRC